MRKGIDVIDDEGHVRGKSKMAAKKAVLQTAFSRFVCSIPMFVPPLLLYIIEKARMMPKNYWGRSFVELAACTIDIYLSVPLAIAMFPQTGKIGYRNIEKEF